MNYVSLIVTALLVTMALWHFYWALGGTLGLDKALPTKDGKRLFSPGKAATFTVGALLLFFAWVASSLHFATVKTDFLLCAGWTLCALFALRAVGEFNAVGFFKTIRSTDFARYDTKLFSPLCAGLAVAFALLSARA